MRAVIVGGNGFIGSHLVDALLHEHWQVVVYDRYPERFRSPIPQVEYVYGEFENTTLLGSVLSRADIVFHLVSTTTPRSSNESPVFDIQTNLIGSVNFLHLCVKAKVGKVVFLSSGGTVYGIPQDLPVKELHETNPICSYGIVKLAIEKYLLLFQQLYDLPYTILRPSNPYGQRQNPDGEQGVVAVFLGRVARGLPITIWGNGEVVRDYFFVKDLAVACVRAGTLQIEPKLLNIGSGAGLSLNQLLASMETVIGREIQIVRLPPRPFDVPELVLDVSLANQVLNWSAKTPLEEGLKLTWEWIESLKGQNER